jgi:hypothetical protein
LTFATLKGIIQFNTIMNTNFIRLNKFKNFLFLGLLTLISCKENTTSIQMQGEYIVISTMDVSPARIDFHPEMGIIDTSATVTLIGSYYVNSAKTPNYNLHQPTFLFQVIRKSDGEFMVDGEFSQSGESISASFNLPLKTVDFNDFRIFVFAISNEELVSNTIQSTIRVRGFAVAPPIIDFAQNPDTVRIPTTGEQPFLLTARVYHPFQQSLIDRVMVNIRDQNNNLLAGSPFQLFDDGGATGNNSGDLVANDSTFSRAFRINNSNNPDSYRLFYFAIDNLGLSSDTIHTQMVIVR